MADIERRIRFCNAISPTGIDACELERGHHGKHRAESFTNPPYHEWSDARPCCHSTGPNHHPTCETEQQQ